MKMSFLKPRWSALGLIMVLALLALLAGWFLISGNTRTVPLAAQAGKEAGAVPDSGSAAGAQVAENDTEPRQAGAGATQSGSVQTAATKVQRLEHVEQSPAWAVKYGQEFWHPARAASEAAGVSAPDGTQFPPGMNLGDVVERVRHAWMDNGAGSAPEVRSRTYTATLGEDGLVFSPNRPAATSEQSAGGQSQPGSGREMAVRGQPGVRSAAPAPTEADPETAAHFRTESVAQGEQTLFAADQASRSWVVLGNTAQGLLNEATGLVEHYEARNGAVEVSWVLAQPLAGSGTLVFEASLAGLSYAGQTEQGYHFADSSGRARVRVGGVEVVDATGQRWAAALSVAGNRLRVEVPDAVLAQATYPLAIDPALEAEFGLDNPVMGPLEGNQTTPAVAGNASGYLVVWMDDRNGEEDIFGTRVTSAGVVSDPGGIAICMEAGDQQWPAVAVSSSGYLVVWSDSRNGDYDIYGARVTSAGLVSDPGGIAICTEAGYQFTPTVAASGSGYLVAWRDDRNGDAHIYGTRVTSAGVVSDPSGIAICTAANGQSNPALAASGSGYLVVWEDYRNGFFSDIYGARVSTTGLVSDPNGIAICTATDYQQSPAVAASGSAFLVVWMDKRNGGMVNYHIYGARVTSAGAVSDPSGIAICTADDYQGSPKVAASGSGYLVVWEDERNSGATGRDIYGARVTSAGKVSDANGIAICTAAGNQTSPAMAASGSGYLVVWQDERNSDPASPDVVEDIYGARVSTAGVVSPAGGSAIGISPNNEENSAVASNGTNYLVVWADSRNGATTGQDVYGARVTSAGAVSDPNGIAICTAGDYQGSPKVASSGGGYLVVWDDYRNGSDDIYGARVTSAGKVSDPAGIAICAEANDQYSPAIAGSSGGYLVVWEDYRNGSYDVYGSRVSTDGVVLDAGLPICTGAGYRGSPAVAANSSSYLVVWHDYRNGNYDIYGAWVPINWWSPIGNDFGICTAAGDQYYPAVAANGSDYLVVWTDFRSGVALEVYGARVTSGGWLPDGDGFNLCPTMDYLGASVVAADGTNYVVAWCEGSSLVRTRVSAAGAVLDSAPLAVSGSMGRYAPALAYGGGGKFLLSSTGWRNGTDRALGTLITGGRPAAGPVLAFQSAAFQVSETGQVATITVALSGNNSGLISVDYVTGDGTALAGADYTTAWGTLYFSSGKTKQTFTVPVADNTWFNADKTVNLMLSNPQGGATLGLQHRAVLTIKNDDAGGRSNWARQPTQ